MATRGEAADGTIVLAGINARYRHTSFGLRYLLANLGDLADRARLVETQVKQPAEAIVDELLSHAPAIVGLGVYVWNATRALEVVRLLKAHRPEVVVVLGGPEVSHEWEEQPIVALADYTVTGEGEVVFRHLCEALLRGERPPGRIRPGATPPMAELALPYHLYTDEDIAHRVLYVEASRGCPFRCQFCLSSLDAAVRMVPLERLFAELDTLIARGARAFKFIDRTFNLRIRDATAILRFFLDRLTPGLSLHFEMVPDRLPEALRGLLEAFPPGVVQLEIGIQSWSPEVGRRIERRQDPAATEANLRFLAEQTGVHVHADLIVGLPGEDLASFGAGFDRLVALGPQEIQVGILKRLRGTPITCHDAPHQMIYSPEPPYEIVSTGAMSVEEVDAMKRFARYWDLLANSGNFIESTPTLWADGASPFAAFFALSTWLHETLGRTHHLPLNTLVEALLDYLVGHCASPAAEVALTLARDLHRSPGRKTPRALKAHLPEGWRPAHAPKAQGGLVRQARHAAL